MFLRITLGPKCRNLPVAAMAASMLAACAGDVAPPPSYAISGQAALQRIYRLGVGDKIKITVFGEDNLSGIVDVNASGNVPLPLAGEVPARGMTIAEFRSAVSRRLADGYLQNPKVTVEVLNYRPIYVHGEVKSAGEFQYKPGLMLRDAVAMAGGFTYRANETYALVVRDGEQPASLPLSASVAVLPGDNIRITERFF